MKKIHMLTILVTTCIIMNNSSNLTACNQSDFKILNEQLRSAVTYADFQEVEKLLERGADMHHQGRKALSALDIAQYRKNKEMLEFLQNYKNTNNQELFKERCKSSNSMYISLDQRFRSAVACDKRADAQYFLEQGADINDQDSIFGNALHIAALYNNRSMIQFLIESGINKEARNHNGQTYDEILRNRSGKKQA